MPLEVTFPDGSVRQFADGTPPETIRSSWQAPTAPEAPIEAPAPEAWPAGVAGVGRGTLELLKGIVPGAAGAVTSLGETTGAIADLIRRHAGMEPGPLRQWSRDAQKWVEDQFPAHPEANLTRAVGQGLGQIGEVLGETVLTSGGSLLPKAATLGERLLAGKATAKAAGHYAAARMAPAEFADAYTRSLEQGDDPDLAVAKSLGYATVAAMLEDRLGAGKLARKLVSPALVEKVGATPVGRFLRDSLNNVVSNATEESAQRLAQDLIVTGKPDLKGIVSEGLVGGIVGAIAGAPGSVRVANAVASPEQRAYVADLVSKEVDPTRKAALEEYLGNLAELPTPKARKLTFEEVAAKEGFAPDQIDFVPNAKPVPVHRGPALELVQTAPEGAPVGDIQPVSAVYKLGDAAVNVTSDSVTVQGASPPQIPDIAGALVQQNLVKPKIEAGDQTEALTKAIAEVQARPPVSVEADTVGGKTSVYLPAIRSPQHLKAVLREEKAHTRIATPEGQAALDEFMRASPLSEKQFQDLVDKGYSRRPEETYVDGEHPDISSSKDQLYKTRLTDEFLAKLNRDPKWKQWSETAVAWVKKTFGMSLRPEQAGRLVLRSLRNVAPVATPSAPLRESISPDELVSKAQSEFPTAPKFQIGTETKFQGDRITLDPGLASRPEWDQQNEIRAAVMEAGVNLLPPKALSEDLFFRLQVGDARRVESEARRLGVDTATTEGRKAVAASILLQHVHDARLGGRTGGWLPSVIKPDFGLLDSGSASAVARLATTLGLSLFGNKGARGLLAARGILQGILDSAKQTESMPNAAVDQAQVMADLARPDILTYAPWVARLRSMAGELEARSFERRLFRTLDTELQGIAGDGRSRQTGDESKKYRETPEGPEKVVLNPASESFPEDMKYVGRELTTPELHKHERYLAEIQARVAVKLLDGIDSLASTIAYLEGADARVDLSQAREDRNELLEKLDKLGPGPRSRANEIRASDALLPHADAARRVLEDPHLLAVAETIDPHAGTTLRDEASLSEQERSALEVASAATANQAWVFRDRVTKAAQEFTEKSYLPGMRKLRARLLARLQKAGEMDVAMTEVMAAAAAEADQAGTLTGREAATALRDQDTAIRNFAEALARARPDTRVWELRQALLSGLDPASDLWTTRYEGLVLDAAREASISQDAVGRILGLLRRSPEFQNAILELHNTASEQVTRATITAIESIEQALADQAQAEAQAEVGADTEARQEGRDRAKRARDLVRDTAAAHLRQLNGSRKAALAEARSLRNQIAELEVQREQHDLLQDIADSAIRELPNTRRMVYEFQDGVKLDAFGTQPAVTIRPGQAYDSALLNQIVQWQENARAQLDTVDPQTRRGLLVALGDDATPSLVGAFVDTHFASDLIENTLAPSYPVDWLSRKGFIRTKELLPRIVHGFWGRRISETERNYVDVSRKVELLSSREGAARHALMLKAFKSLGLNPRTIEGQVKFRAVYNEFANELRQFGSGVEAGQKVWSSGLEGAVVTNELLTLLRNDRRVGRLGQQIEANRAYGGARENFPGRQVVRRQGETGDVGLSRMADSAIVLELARKYELAPRTNGAITDRTAIDAFWADADARDALRSHIRSALRTDMATGRMPEMQTAEGRLARAIDSGRIELRRLRTVDDWADAIQGYLPGGTTIRAAEQLRAELDQYGAVAMSRNRTPDGGPVESTFSGKGEGDRTGFTSAAAKMAFPPSWYNYGAVNGLRGLLSEIADPAQVEYLETLKQASKELTTTAEKIKSALQSRDEDKVRLLNELAPLIRWHTTSWTSGTKITPERAEAAAEKMKVRASILADEYNRLLNPRVETVGKFNRLLSNILPFLLLLPTAWASNVFGGPVALQPIFSRLVGQTKGTAMSVGSMGLSAGGMVYNIARDIGESFGVVPASKFEQFLQSEGVGANFDRQASGEQEAFSTGTLPRNRVQRGVDVVKAGADQLSEYVGVRRGDRDLNLLVARAVVPFYIRTLQGISAAWQASGEPTLGVSATKQAAGVREWLGKFGNPEEVLTQIADIEPRRFYESKLGRRIGYALIEEANASTKTNRPSSNSLLALMGWTTHMLDMLAAAFRVPANATRSEKMRKAAVTGAAGALAMSIAYYVQIVGRRGVNETISKLSENLGTILAGVPKDIDDPNLLDKLLNWLAEVNGMIRAHVWGAGAVEDLVRVPVEALGRASTPTAKLTPLHPEFWDRPWQEVAGDLALSVPGGIGVNNVQLPALGILQQTVTTGLQAGRGIQTIATNPGSPAARAGGMEDIATAGRNALNLLGLVGATLAEVAVPGGNAGRASRSQIVDAANRAGIQVEAPFSSGKWLNPTPVRKGLLAAGRELLAAEAAGADTTAAQNRIDNLTQFLAERAEKHALDRGEDAATAKQAGVDAVKRILPDLNPYRHAIGRPLTDKELADLKARVGNNPEVQKDEKAAQAVVRAASRKYRFPVSRGMKSPVKRKVRARVLTLR